MSVVAQRVVVVVVCCLSSIQMFFIHSTKEKQKKLFIIMLVLVVVVTYDHIQYTAFRPFSLRFMVTKTYHASPMLRHLGEVLLFKFCLFKQQTYSFLYFNYGRINPELVGFFHTVRCDNNQSDQTLQTISFFLRRTITFIQHHSINSNIYLICFN